MQRRDEKQVVVRFKGAAFGAKVLHAYQVLWWSNMFVKIHYMVYLHSFSVFDRIMDIIPLFNK